MQNLQTVRVKVTQLEKEDGELTKNDEETADKLCRSFKEVFTIEDINRILEEDHREKVEQQGDQLQNINFRMWNLQQNLFIKATSSRLIKTPGPDGMHPHLLKSCANM